MRVVSALFSLPVGATSWSRHITNGRELEIAPTRRKSSGQGFPPTREKYAKLTPMGFAFALPIGVNLKKFTRAKYPTYEMTIGARCKCAVFSSCRSDLLVATYYERSRAGDRSYKKKIERTRFPSHKRKSSIFS